MIANIPNFSILTILLQVSLNLQSVNCNVIPVGYSLSDAEAPAATTSNPSSGNYPSYTENTIGAPRPTVPTNRWNPQSSVHPSRPPMGTVYPSNPQNPVYPSSNPQNSVYPSNPQNPPNPQNSGPPQVIPHPHPQNPNYPSNPSQDECSEDDEQPTTTSQLPSALYPLPNEPIRTIDTASTVTQFSSPPVSIVTIQSSTTITNSNGAIGGSGEPNESVSTVFSTTTDSAGSSSGSTDTSTASGTQSDASATSSPGSEATNASSYGSSASESTGSPSSTGSGNPHTSSGSSSGAEKTGSSTSSGGTFTEATKTASSTTSEAPEPTNGYRLHLAQYMYVNSTNNDNGKEQWSGWGPRIWTFHFNDSYRSEVFDMYKYEAKTGDGGKMETGTCQETLRCTASVTESPGSIYSVTVEPGFPATSTITGSAFLGCSSPTPAPPRK